MAIKPEPIIILVEPQLGENIGMCARAMLNCGLHRLRLVKPREGWPNEKARATAADADVVIDQVEVFDSLDEAVGDCHRVFATTARDRSLNVPLMNVDKAIVEAGKGIESGQAVAILFGPEASGLDNEAIARADVLLRFPTNPEFSSLNLAQAVLLLGWEWRRLEEMSGEEKQTDSADRASVEVFFRRLEDALDEKSFFLTPELRPHSVRALRSIFHRSCLSRTEVQLLHGMLTALASERADPTSIGDAGEE